MLVAIYQSTWHRVPEDSNLHLSSCENLRSHVAMFIYICSLMNVHQHVHTGLHSTSVK
jgi:hypothetical protein